MLQNLEFQKEERKRKERNKKGNETRNFRIKFGHMRVKNRKYTSRQRIFFSFHCKKRTKSVIPGLNRRHLSKIME